MVSFVGAAAMSALLSVQLVPEFTRASRFPGGEGALDLAPWRRHAPGVQDVSIASTADGSAQRAMFYDSGSPAQKPLVVVLHSWSTDFRQNIGIPYAVFAQRNDWVFIHPDFRGPYRRPEAAASDLVAQDILDAVEHATRHARVDPARIYLAGFSGGGMTALAMAARRPDLWAGVLAWAPIVDLPAWYEHNATRFPKRRYARDIAAVCGGAPRPGTPAWDECRRRSPVALLERAREAGVPIYVATGLRDNIVPPDHTMRAWNLLANPDDRLSEEVIRHISVRGAVPAGLQGKTAPPELAGYARAGAAARLERTSGRATMVLFDGTHDVVYNPGLAWLSRQRRP